MNPSQAFQHLVHVKLLGDTPHQDSHHKIKIPQSSNIEVAKTQNEDCSANEAKLMFLLSKGSSWGKNHSVTAGKKKTKEGGGEESISKWNHLDSLEDAYHKDIIKEHLEKGHTSKIYSRSRAISVSSCIRTCLKRDPSRC
jgi:hypothetical protein